MSKYHWNTLQTYEDQISISHDFFVFSSIAKVSVDRSILLSAKLLDAIRTTHDILQVLCFIESDDILPYPYMITCINPAYTWLLRHLAENIPDKWFLATIDKKGRFHLPIDTLETIRITKKAFISSFNGFSWSIMDPDQESLSYNIFVDKVNSWEISIPQELLGNDTDIQK
jgi:hypothetical protein